jgi:hypothetical protein
MTIEYLKELYYILLFCSIAALLTARFDIPRDFAAPDHYMAPDAEGWETLMSTDSLAKAADQLYPNPADNFEALSDSNRKPDSLLHFGPFQSIPRNNARM